MFNLAKLWTMPWAISAIVFTLFLLSSCAALDKKMRASDGSENRQSGQLSAAEQQRLEQLVASLKSLCQSENQQIIKNQENIIATLNTAVPSNKFVQAPGICPEVDLPNPPYNTKMVLGEVETIAIVYQPNRVQTINLKVDTGADTSSLGVYQLMQFERDGKNWLKFNLSAEPNGQVWEYAIKRKIKVKQQGQVQGMVRPVIELAFYLGQELYFSEFSIADRHHLKYQGLLGRSFLKDIAIVDVAESHLQAHPISTPNKP